MAHASLREALVTGMSHALFNRRGSNKNQGLMKSLMAAISKEFK
jgi:hypothetical protein